MRKDICIAACIWMLIGNAIYLFILPHPIPHPHPLNELLDMAYRQWFAVGLVYFMHRRNGASHEDAPSPISGSHKTP